MIYRFGHQIIRDTAYGGLLKRSRAVLHERFVTWAERTNRERGRGLEFEEILGYHLEQAYRYRESSASSMPRPPWERAARSLPTPACAPSPGAICRPRPTSSAARPCAARR